MKPKRSGEGSQQLPQCCRCVRLQGAPFRAARLRAGSEKRAHRKRSKPPQKPILNTPCATGTATNDICQPGHGHKPLLTSHRPCGLVGKHPGVDMEISQFERVIHREREIEAKMFKVHSCNSLLSLGNAFPPCCFHDVGSISYQRYHSIDYKTISKYLNK